MAYRVLIIDDEEVICAGMRSMVEQLGLPEIGEVALAYDGEEAVARFREKRPDIVITDIRLHDMSGLDVIRQAQRLDPRPRFIVLSGYDDFGYAQEAIRLGVVDYVLKPASREELEAALKAAMLSLKEPLTGADEAGPAAERTVIDVARRYIQENLGNPIDLTVVSNEVSMSYSYFSKLFKNETGTCFSRYLLSARMEHAMKLLEDPVQRINEVASSVGYASPRLFARAFKSYAGIPPRDFRRRRAAGRR
jgi:two-component system, response regulator YesN